jgi:two-component system cell cycle response regulator
VVEDRRPSWERLQAMLGDEHEVEVEAEPSEALFRVADGGYDLVVVSLGLENFDGLRLASQVRSLERTRNVPILAIAEAEDNARLMRGLEIGINDYLIRPIDRNELMARVRTQIRRKRYTERLRDNVQMSIEAAITDALTGLHNRRYMETHLKALTEQAGAAGRSLSMLLADIDNFKSINDTYGHDAGDNVLRELAARFRRNTRNIDLACRIGGEEFVVVMPDTGLERACQVAERLRECIAGEPFQANRDTRLKVTASVGIATLEGPQDSPEGLLKRADQALYVAKRGGRNRVVADAA